jgi:glycosyltransferase involved in cell wall biosynthesis
MAMRKPVIAFDVGGVVEMVEDGVTGAIVHFAPEDAGSVERLAGTMLRYARDADLRSRQGRAARERVERDFDARAHAARIENEIVLAARLG